MMKIVKFSRDRTTRKPFRQALRNMAVHLEQSLGFSSVLTIVCQFELFILVEGFYSQFTTGNVFPHPAYYGFLSGDTHIKAANPPVWGDSGDICMVISANKGIYVYYTIEQG
jgi:hypothetical protein